MNRFRVNLHPALFGGNGEMPGVKYEGVDGVPEEEKTAEEVNELQDLILMNQAKKTEKGINKKLEALEGLEGEKLAKKLEKLLKQLAKNKGIDLPWTNNEWKCSSAEKKLGKSSVKVFMQLLAVSNDGRNRVREIFNKCRSQNGPLDDLTAQSWGKDLGINSKIKDIQSFYEAYTEYQNSQSQFVHLQGLMDFFNTGGIDSIDKLISTLKEQVSHKISKSDVRNARNDLYEKERSDTEGRYIYTNKETGERVDDKSERTLYTRYNIVRERLKNENDPTERMLKLLCDFNFDGEVNTGDANNRTGGQFAEVFIRERAVSKANGGSGSETITNLIAYAKKMGVNLDDSVKDEASLFDWMTKPGEGYNNTKSLQGLIKTCPADLADVLDNGANAGRMTLNSLIRYEESMENIESGEELEKLVDQKAKEIIEQNRDKVEKMYSKEESAKIMQQLLSQLPTALLDHAKEVQRGGAIGKTVPLDQIIKGMSAGFHLGINDGGNPIFGLFLGWSKSIDLGKGADLSIGANVGVNASGEKLHFIPCGVVSAEIGKDVKRAKRNKTLDGAGVGRIHLGGNAIVVPGGIPAAWGISLGYDYDKLKGIEDQAVNIRNVIQDNAYGWILDMKDGKDLKTILSDKYPGTSPKMLEDATRNLKVIFDTLNIDELIKGREDFAEDDIRRYSKVVADVFAEQRETNQKIGIADNVWRVSGGGIGIEFFAGAFPAVSAALKFSRYNNLRVTADERSQYRRMEAEILGKGNRSLDKLDQKSRLERTESFNEILKGFGITENLLKYQESGKEEDGIPGKIKVPRALAERINIRVNSNMKEYVQSGTDEKNEIYYLFPANADFRFLTEGLGNQKKAILNIGGYRNKESDINILDDKGMNGLIGNKDFTEGKRFLDKPDLWTTSEVEYGRRDDVLQLFENPEVKNIIKTIDSYGGKASWAKFSEFVAHKTSMEKSGNEINEMAKNLADIMRAHPQNDKLQGIIAKLEEEIPSGLPYEASLVLWRKLMEEKLLILDRALAISANANVTDITRLNNLVGAGDKEGQRGTTFLSDKLIGQNGQAIFNLMGEKAVDFREKLRAQNEGVGGNFTGEIVEGLIGATAFYHRNNKAKGLALTGLGVTSVLNGKTETLTGEEENLAKAWFLGGAYKEKEMPGVLSDKSTAELCIIQTSMVDYIKKAIGGKDFKIMDGNSERGLSLNDVISLLRGETIDISLDNSGKKDMIRLKLDVEYVFYLMGECANESVGMKLGKFHILPAVDAYHNGKMKYGDVNDFNRATVNKDSSTIGVVIRGGGNEGENSTEEPDGQAGSENYNNGINTPGGGTTNPGETSGKNGQGSNNYNNGINNPSSPTGVTPPPSSGW